VLLLAALPARGDDRPVAVGAAAGCAGEIGVTLLYRVASGPMSVVAPVTAVRSRRPGRRPVAGRTAEQRDSPAWRSSRWCWPGVHAGEQRMWIHSGDGARCGWRCRPA
jgi:hypothetical protein